MCDRYVGLHSALSEAYPTPESSKDCFPGYSSSARAHALESPATPVHSVPRPAVPPNAQSPSVEGCVSVTVPPHLPCGDHLGSGPLVNIVNQYFLRSGRSHGGARRTKDSGKFELTMSCVLEPIIFCAKYQLMKNGLGITQCLFLKCVGD